MTTYGQDGAAAIRIRLGAGGADLGFAAEVETYARQALARAKPDRPLDTNVEFYTAILLDADGAIGRAYGARVTPQVFVVDPEGVVVYAGALDDQPKATEQTLPGAINYVAMALEEALAGRPVSIPRTEPFGCDVRYARAKGNR